MSPEGLDVRALITDAPMHVEGALTEASNLTLRVQFIVDDEPSAHRGVYKPIEGERPLHDFPTGTLAQREVAAYQISQWGGWGLIPRTILRDGPLGVGSVQEWKEIADDESPLPASGLLDVVPVSEVPPGWLSVVEAEDHRGLPLSVIHRDTADLASLAVLDVVLNNADRKAAHIALDAQGRLWGFDHGLIGHVMPKLRTVLWGWAGQPLPQREIARLEQLTARLDDAEGNELSDLLSTEEIMALRERVQHLLAIAEFPDVPYGRYPLPWPLW